MALESGASAGPQLPAGIPAQARKYGHAYPSLSILVQVLKTDAQIIEGQQLRFITASKRFA